MLLLVINHPVCLWVSYYGGFHLYIGCLSKRLLGRSSGQPVILFMTRWLRACIIHRTMFPWMQIQIPYTYVSENCGSSTGCLNSYANIKHYFVLYAANSYPKLQVGYKQAQQLLVLQHACDLDPSLFDASWDKALVTRSSLFSSYFTNAPYTQTIC